MALPLAAVQVILDLRATLGDEQRVCGCGIAQIGASLHQFGWIRFAVPQGTFTEEVTSQVQRRDLSRVIDCKPAFHILGAGRLQMMLPEMCEQAVVPRIAPNRGFPNLHRFTFPLGMPRDRQPPTAQNRERRYRSPNDETPTAAAASMTSSLIGFCAFRSAIAALDAVCHRCSRLSIEITGSRLRIVQSAHEVARRRIREERERRGWSQEQLATNVRWRTSGRVSLHPTAVTRLEKGQRSISLDEAVAFALALGLTVSELIGHADVDQTRFVRLREMDKITSAALDLAKLISGQDAGNVRDTEAHLRAVAEATDSGEGGSD